MWCPAVTLKSCSIPGEGHTHVPKDSSQDPWLRGTIPAASALTSAHTSFYFSSFSPGQPGCCSTEGAEPSRALQEQSFVTSHYCPLPSLPQLPRVLLMDDGARAGWAVPEEGSKALPGAAPALSSPGRCRARSYLVSCSSLLAVGALQEHRLFGKFI